MMPASFYEAQRREKALTRMIRQMAREPEKIRVDTWLGGYRGLYPDERNDDTKRVQYEYLRPFRRAYGNRKMSTITAIEAQAWALKHARSQIRLLKRAWNHAVQMQVAPLNVWLFVVLPKSTRAKRRPPTDAELQAALERAEARWPTLANMIRVAAYSGAREGGLLGLRRCDVDLDAGRMSVLEKGAKRRTVLLCGPALGAMEHQFAMRHQHLWQQRKLVRGASPLVFVNSELPSKHPARHRAIAAPILRDRWKQVRGDFPHGFHSLRHYAATWLAAQGISPLDIAVQLGHTDAQGRPYERLVQRVYDHPDPERVLERIAAALPTEREGS